MKIVQTLICYGLRQVVGDVADKAVDLVAERLTNEGDALPQAVKEANDRAWRALNVALAGDSYWEKFKRYALGDATQRALRQQIEIVLGELAKANKTQLELVRANCLNDLMRLRRSKEFKSNILTKDELKHHLAAWQHYTDPKQLIDGAWRAVAEFANELATSYPDLARLLRQRVGEEQPLLTALFSFFLRQEIAKNNELVNAMTFDLVGKLSAAQENAFLEVDQTLAKVGDKIDEIFEELDVIKKQLEGLDAKVAAKLDQLGMRMSMVRPQDSLSIHNQDEREAVRRLLRQFRELPVGQQRQVPALLNNLGKLLVGAGDFGKARSAFSDAAQLAFDAASRAERYYNYYRAAVEQRDWDRALKALQQAAALDRERFTFFPDRYRLERILGAGGFGTAFLCHDEHFDQQVVVKTLHADMMERSVKDVFNEAQVLRRLSDRAIIAVLDCDFANQKDKKRPYIVMEYFPGMTLRAYVEKHGELTTKQYIEVARQIISGMRKAHRQGVLHRDLKPDNIMVLREGEQFVVKIIDFGLALRRSVVERSEGQQGAEQTVLGRSAAGTLAYSAPEQLGRLPNCEPKASSDVYAFGRSSWFALFKTPVPCDKQKNSIPRLATLLDKCTKEHPEDRYPDFETVLLDLDRVDIGPPPPPEKDSALLSELLRAALIAARLRLTTQPATPKTHDDYLAVLRDATGHGLIDCNCNRNKTQQQVLQAAQTLPQPFTHNQLHAVLEGGTTVAYNDKLRSLVATGDISECGTVFRRAMSYRALDPLNSLPQGEYKELLKRLFAFQDSYHRNVDTEFQRLFTERSRGVAELQQVRSGLEDLADRYSALVQSVQEDPTLQKLAELEPLFQTFISKLSDAVRMSQSDKARVHDGWPVCDNAEFAQSAVEHDQGLCIPVDEAFAKMRGISVEELHRRLDTHKIKRKEYGWE